MTKRKQIDWKIFKSNLQVEIELFLRRIRMWYKKLIAYRFFEKYHIVKLGLKPDYYDPDTRVIYAIMSILCDFVENEKCFEVVNWEWTARHRFAKVELLRAYKWWKQFENYVEEIWEEELKKPDDISSAADTEIFDKENWWYEEATRHAMNVVKNRLFLWT